MSNGARHTWGVLLGLVLTAALAGLLVFGSYRLQHGYMMGGHGQDKWIGGGMLAGAAVVYAFMVASRVSPLASLIGGLVLTAAGVLFFVSQHTTADLINRFPYKSQRVTLSGLEEDGFLLFAGVGLLFASFFPSRWRARRRSDAAYEYGVPDDDDDPFSRRAGGASSARGGRHALRDDDDLTPTYGSPRPSDYGSSLLGDYGPSERDYGGASSQTEFDAPLYEPERPGAYEPDPPIGRSRFLPPDDDDGGTREMRGPR